MKPRTRKENYLAKIAKDPDAVEMTPHTRTEHYLNEIAENGGSALGSLYYELQQNVIEEPSATTFYFLKSDIDAVKALAPIIIKIADVCYYQWTNLKWAKLTLKSSTSVQRGIELSGLNVVVEETTYSYRADLDAYVFSANSGGNND